MIVQRPTAMTRRAVLRGAGVGALGLAGAALLGCKAGGKTATTSSGGSPTAGGLAGAGTGTQTLPLVAPVVQGTPKKGGTFNESGGAATFAQHDSERPARPWRPG